MADTLTVRFDWFSVTADYEPGELVDTYARLLQAEPRNVRAVNGYQRAVGLFLGDQEEVRVQWSDTGRPNIVASGYPSQRVFEVTKARFPSYALARGDVAVDFDDADVFEVAHGAMRRLSHERAIKHHIQGDWETPGSPDGRTTYAGVRKSAAFRRLYEFAKHHGYGAAVRFEVEFKPPSKQKAHYAGMGPLELLQCDGYAVELLRRLGFGVDRLRIAREAAGATPNAWFAHLVRQYGPKLVEYIARQLEGDATRLGPAITAAYEAEQAHRRHISNAAAADSGWTSLVQGGQPMAT